MRRDRSVLLANAGSGKTFTLANRVLAWCLAEIRAGRPATPANILAVTFTRKAAGEILARIVSHAALGARDDEQGAKARKDFAGSVGDASVGEYRAILAAICDDLHRMQVGTIDGYLHRVATSMPEELGLPCDWTIAEPHEMDEIHAAATAAVLADPVAEELLDLLEDGAPKPTVGASIEALLGDSAYAVLTLYRATAAGGEAALDRAWGWASRLRREVGGDGTSRRERLDQLVKDLEAAPLARNAKGEVNGKWTAAHQKVVTALREGRISDAGTRFVTGILETGSYSSARAPDGLRPVLERVASEVRTAYLDDLVGRIEGARRAMPIAEEALRSAQEERGLYSFTDIGRAVALAARNPVSRAASAAELRAALGCEVRALAIDEAQDTSVAQFRALRPLIDEVLGAHGTPGRDGGKFLLVGDPKQSIYGWRGGVPGQIESFRREAAAFLDPDETLSRSYRSSPLVMAFVNAVFGTLGEDLLPLVADEDREDLVGMVDFLRKECIDPRATTSAFKRTLEEWRFIAHEAAKPEIPGWIRCYAAGEHVAESVDGSEDAVEGEPAEATVDVVGIDGIDGTAVDEGDGSSEIDVPEAVARVVARIHRARPTSTVAVLVRDNKSLANIVACLKEEGVDASDEGRSTLLDSPPVVLLVNLLQLIDSPSDRVAHFVVSHSVLAAPLALAPSERHGDATESDAAAARFADGMRARIADEGLGAFLQWIFRLLDACSLPGRDRARLARAVSIGELFDANPPARLAEVVTAIDADESGAGSSHPVRVMTVHAAKGLEFDEVVLASLHAPWDRAPKGWAMLVMDPSREPDLVGPLMNSEARAWIPELELLKRDNMRRALLDEISSLYVAITRARKGLHLVFDNRIDFRAKPCGAGLVARVLRRLCGADPSGPDQAGDESTLPAAAWRNAGDFDNAWDGAIPGDDEPFWSIAFEGAVEAKPGASGSAASGPVLAAAPHVADGPLFPSAVAGAGRDEARRGRTAGASGRPPSEHTPRSPWAQDPFGDDDIALRGVLVHEYFREVRSVEDIAADPRETVHDGARMRAAARRASVEKATPIDAELVRDVSEMLRRLVTGVGRDGSVAEALRVGPDDEVRTEVPFVLAVSGATSSSRAALVHGRIDRLVLTRDAGGRVVRASIVDFKTGAAGASTASFAAKVDSYRGQLEAYREAVAELWGLPLGSVGSTLLFVDRDEVVRLA